MKKSLFVSAMAGLLAISFISCNNNAGGSGGNSKPKTPEELGLVRIEKGRYTSAEAEAYHPLWYWDDGYNILYKRNYIKVDEDIYLCDHETTTGEFEKYMTYDEYSDNFKGSEGSPEYFNTPNFPVDCPWIACIIYCNVRSKAEKLTPAYYIEIDGENVTDIDTWIDKTEYKTYISKDNTGKYFINSTKVTPENKKTIPDLIKWNKEADGYRLPTEVEWVYAACKGKNKNGDFWHDEDREEKLQYMWLRCNTFEVNKGYQEVKTNLPNELGLYDMVGSVSEWCWDRFTPSDTDFRNIPLDGPAEYVSKNINRRSIRATSALSEYYPRSSTIWVRAAGYTFVTDRGEMVGFRVARTIKEAESTENTDTTE